MILPLCWTKSLTTTMQDVPRFTVVAGNPAKVSRGIYDGSADAQ